MTVIATAINVLYEESDRGLWDATAGRTNLDEVTARTCAEELAIAHHNARLTGVSRVQTITRPDGKPIKHTTIPFQISMQGTTQR